MELELVEKVFSLDTPGRDNQRKAVYRISHPQVRFWFCFLYADSSLLLRMTPLAFFFLLVCFVLRNKEREIRYEYKRNV